MKSIAILFFLLATLLFGIVLVQKNQLKKFEGTSITSNEESIVFNKKYKLLSPVLGHIPKEELLVNFSPLRKELTKIVESYPSADISIYFEYLNTGANISINGDLRQKPASLSKLPLAIIILHKIEQGEISLSDIKTITQEDKSSTWGELFKEPVGTEISIKQLIGEMIINSDNTAQNILFKLVTEKDVEDIVSGIGIEELFNEEGEVSVKEYSRLLRTLYTGLYLSLENSEELLNLMTLSTRERYIPNTLPKSVPVAHKFGTDNTNGYFNDSGIIYAKNRPYILIVLVSAKEDASQLDAQKIISEISQEAYNHVEKK